jgi:hypothetical protein
LGHTGPGCTSKFWGPYEILEIRSPVTVRLKLPRDMRIHDVFHVNLIEPYRPSEKYPQPAQPYWDIPDLDAPDVYDVEKIVDQKWDEKRNTWMYLVRWLGYDESEDTWEPANNISSRLLKKTTLKRKNLRKRAVGIAEAYPDPELSPPSKKGPGRPLKERGITK